MTKQICIQLDPFNHKCVSRSEAREILADTKGFEEVIFDFDGISMIGQGFADEIYRIFHGAHPGVKLSETNMCLDVAFMIARSRPKKLKNG